MRVSHLSLALSTQSLISTVDDQLSLSKSSTNNGSILINEVSAQVSTEEFSSFTSVSGMFSLLSLTRSSGGLT